MNRLVRAVIGGQNLRDPEPGRTTTKEEAMADHEIVLYSNGLLSKWGFNDGDCPEPVYDYCDCHKTPLPDWDQVLVRLVRERIIPALDQKVEVHEVQTSHNPIRATCIDGVAVPSEVIYGDQKPSIRLTPEEFRFTVEEILALDP